ncbi:MAG: alternative ribosome rescue aminoacyl-tRNA hydrolase ArfB [Vicingaceae bacterium]
MQALKERPFLSELSFKTSRSSGKGGQHVNKTESRVSLFFDVEQSQILSEDEKQLIYTRMEARLNEGKIIQIDVEESRSQKRNKEIAIQRFLELVSENLKRKKKRKVSKPTKAAIKKRLKAKKKHGEKKQNRRKDNLL